MLNQQVNETVELVDRKLEEYLPQQDIMQADLINAMRYSLLSGGKRIRPLLLLEFCRICGGDVHAALPFACAIEMAHTYSLIHDDLPCMDDDDMRRGRPSNHKVFGEDTALLAGDALLTLAFETMLSEESVRLVGAERAVAAAGILAHAAGAYGMVGGQVVDLMSEGRVISLKTLQEMDENKTGALILAAAKMGCVLAGANESQLKAAENYAKAIGLAFQIVDDILDVTGDSETLGKPVGSDDENSKCTYVTLMGLDNAKIKALELTDAAVRALEGFESGTEVLSQLARELVSRDK
ncbi:polyprenyl synthetase family protein [Caproiciproducens galactitolivorans]|uniref:Farnesyl diphosphate synthase n=1 Tax=Caproiciproducens galactitolivorans TaxID=642589 RepID=A0A4Z0Y935_9FIRM|nr:farnesyl diphosphate synthase [Caproiciproducens galactitolivorans]QEY33960.1 polyprenyl synthetase family protein [Caproiciproducens galactitolivorans]TGJ76075.1 farnesyl diphosphate synthase [Caproiciproducens galactitolivorans]